MTRTIHFQGIDNFRDLGGLSGRFGPISSGLLFRSGHLGGATEEDLRRLSDLALDAIVDLRRPSERLQAPNRLPAGFTGAVLTSDQGDRAESPHIAFLRQDDLSDAAIERYLIGYYRQAPFEPRHRDLFARGFALIADSPGPVLIHCAAGKDRTGLLAALIQQVLGAHGDDVMNDFLAINASASPERIAAARSALARLTGRQPSEAALKGYLGVAQNHLEAALAEINRRGGGLEAYLESLGVDQDTQHQIRLRFLI